ncbi:hornerin-like [Plodia interpunctella]|uniref:hornerin-like n=1 Tax=Plodia interpunctella TaxID=58824 RepID=UPI00236748B6|nr:hornerin-like [Plodia interpunctella]
MNKKILLTLFVAYALFYVEGRKTSRSRSSSSGRGSSRKTSSNPQPAPTSFSYPQPAQKPSLSGWQEKSAQKSVSTWQAKTQTGQSHSYPSSQTGLSGSKAKPSAPNQESIQRSHASQSQSSNQAAHSYPSSNGLSGSGHSGAGYPQGSGLSGSAASRPASSGTGYPHGSGTSGTGNGNPSAAGPGYSHGAQGTAYSSGGVAPPPYPGNNRPYNGGSYPSQNYGNNYHHPPPPPAYSNYGSNYGGYGGHGFYNPGPQTPGYFGNYGHNGFGGVSRTSSALKGVGIAGAGVGTLLTGLALWNLARSTGQHHHTVIYDNRGQPVAVAPANDTEPVEDSFLKDLVNCSLTISNDNATEVLAIPCAIASSFSPDANVKDVSTGDGKSDNTKCTVTVLTKTGKEYMTTIPCATLLNTAAENNVTEPPLTNNGTEIMEGTQNSDGNIPNANQPLVQSFSNNGPDMSTISSAFNCTSEPGSVRDPINPCFAVTTDLTVIPLPTTRKPNDGEK